MIPISIQGILWQNGVRISQKEYEAQGSMPEIKNLPYFTNNQVLTVCPKISRNPFWDVPIVLGTYRWNYNPETILHAISKGVKMIDTAPTYGFGKVTAELSQLDIPGDVRIATKIAKNRMSPGAIKSGWDLTVQKFPGKDIHYQLHWPLANSNLTDVAKSIRNLKQGMFNVPSSFGVCNCDIHTLEFFRQYFMVYTLQIPFNFSRAEDMKDVVKHCRNNNIVVLGYSPFGQSYSHLMKTPGLEKLLKHFSKKENCTPSQFILAWVRSKGVTPIFASNNTNHISENLESVSIILKDTREFDSMVSKINI